MKLWPMPVIAVEARSSVIVRLGTAVWKVAGTPPYNGFVYWKWRAWS